ncbi:MAG: hypothetical protein ACE366_09180 [Bradymonadia bacterium]
MNATALAEQFNTVGQQLEASEHRLILRQARALLEAEADAEAMGFLRTAASIHGELGPLVGQLEAYFQGGGQSLVLVSDQAWRTGCAHERRFEQQIDAGTQRRDLASLMSIAVQQSAGAAQGQPFTPISAGPVAPETPPPAPRDEGLMVRDINLPELDEESSMPRPGAVATPIPKTSALPQVTDQTPAAQQAAQAVAQSPATPTAPAQKPGVSGKLVVGVVLLLVAVGYGIVRYMLNANS